MDDDTEEVWRDRLGTIFLSFIRRRPEYAQVRLIDHENDDFEIVRIDRAAPNLLLRVPKEELQPKGHADYVTGAVVLPRDSVYLSAVNLNREYDRVTIPWTPTIRASTPVDNNEGKTFGVLVINVNLTGLLDRIDQTVPPWHSPRPNQFVGRLPV